MGKYTRSKQERTHGAYARRLANRGLSKAPTMKSLKQLRGKSADEGEEGEA